jgi:RHS repeat-associated protein
LLSATFPAVAFVPFALFTLSPLAADKSGVTPNAISLPSGPGSIEGLGEAFQPTLNTGTAKYGIGLKLPPGTAGHQPSVSLSYEGGGANGPLGFGWSVPSAHIQRQCDKGIPRYLDTNNGLDDDLDGEVDEYDERDVFINEMKEELVPQADGYLFCENEGAFIRYERRDSYWIGTLPTGTRLEFGVSESARVKDAATGRVFRWCLERIIDTHGNVIVYSYRSFPGEQNLHQVYCAGISYGPGAPPWENVHFVTFAYEDRSDWFEDCRPGFVLRTGKRLKEVLIGTQGLALVGHLAGDFNHDGKTDYLSRKYQLSYWNYAPPNSHWSLLRQVTLIGADGTSRLPPATFGYTVCNPPVTISAREQWIGGVQEPTTVMDNELADLVDLNGDALPDILKTARFGGAHVAVLNLGETNSPAGKVIQWSQAQEVATDDGLAWNVNLESMDNIAHLADMDGDGLADLVNKSANGDVFYFRNLARLRWGQRQLMSVQDFSPPSPFGNPNARTADIDFDKRMDIIESVSTGIGADYRIWFNRGQQRYSRSRTEPQLNGVMFSLAGAQIADFNGDRVPDMVRLRPTSIVVTAGLGHGRFVEPITVPVTDYTFEDSQLARAKLQDVTGDGLVDVLLERAAPGQLWYWINLGNYTLSARHTITDLPAQIGLNAAIRWADLNGNGTTDLVYADSASEPRLVTIDVGRLMGCVPHPNTLTKIENGIGRVTTIQYEPSTTFALRDAAAGRSWPDSLPFPVSVVAAVTTEDSLGNSYLTRFQFHNGHYDAAEKEFRGFAQVEQLEVGDESTPTLVTRHHFDTGRDVEPMKGRLLRQIVEQEDGKVFSEATTTWSLPPKVLRTGVNGQPVRYVHPIGQSQTIQELGQGTERVLESESAYDEYGNPTRSVDYGIVEGPNRSAFNDERITKTEYALNLEKWMVRFPARMEITDENGVVISRSESFYDDETFSGTNFGQVTRGVVTLVREWIDPADPQAFVRTARTKYDAFGNPITFLDPLGVAPGGAADLSRGHGREVRYDERFHRYPVQEIIHVGGGSSDLVIEAEYDLGLGTLTASRDFNGHRTSYGYDTFARMTTMIRPGDTPEYPTQEYDYALAVPFGQRGLVNHIETRMLDKASGSAGPRKRDHYFIARQFSDGLGRSLLMKKEAEPDPSLTNRPRVAVSGAVRFNARREVALSLSPFFSTLSGTNLESLLEFEDIGATNWTGIFHERGNLATLNLATAHQTRQRYNATLRPVETTNADGTRRRAVYEPLVTLAFDENDTDPVSPHFNTPRAHHRDGLGRQVRTDEIVRLNDDGTPASELKTWTTRFEYDLNDRLTRITDSQGNVKIMQYDGLKRVTFMNDPDRGVMHYRYDDASNLLETRDAKDQRITFTYDGVNRILTEDYHDEAQPFSFGFVFDPTRLVSPSNRADVVYFYDTPLPSLDQGDGTTATARNVKGLLAYVWDVAGEEHTSRDERGRAEWIVKRIFDSRSPSMLQPVLRSSTAEGGRFNPSTPLVSYRTGFAYDSMDRLTRLTYPDNDEVHYAYNERNLLASISGGPSGFILPRLSYAPSDQQTGIQYGNGVNTTYAYDQRARLAKLSTLNAQLSTELIHFDYEFDPASNIQAIHDLRPGSVAAEGGKRRNTQVFAYDDLDRLTRVQYSFNLPSQPIRNDGQIHYRYDRIGNMVSQTSDIAHLEKGLSVTDQGAMTMGGSAGAWGRIGRTNAEPGPHAVTRISNSKSQISNRDFPYDGNGNMTSIDGLACTWDFKDRLVRVEDDAMTAEYAYDFTDRRILKRVIPKVGTRSTASPQSGAAGTNSVLPEISNGGDAVERVPTTVLYPGKHFEVREHEQPTKYVWNGGMRVARVTGSLSANERVQRLRLYPGWNLVALAVNSTNAVAQLKAASSPGASLIESIYQWNPDSKDYRELIGTEALSAGAVLWLKSSDAANVSLKGTYSSPTNVQIAASGNYYSATGLQAQSVSNALPPGVTAWFFDAENQRWRSQIGGELNLPSDLPEFLSPSEALFIHAPAPANLQAPEPTLAIRHYHQDHLGSSSYVSDAQGNVVEESAFYPFGALRTNHRPLSEGDPYGFTQKEKDRESGLNYFEARYQFASLGRFLTVDPFLAGVGSIAVPLMEKLRFMPQRLNPYAYVLNNPLKFNDPSGNDDSLVAYRRYPSESRRPGALPLRMTPEEESEARRVRELEAKLWEIHLDLQEKLDKVLIEQAKKDPSLQPRFSAPPPDTRSPTQRELDKINRNGGRWGLEANKPGSAEHKGRQLEILEKSTHLPGYSIGVGVAILAGRDPQNSDDLAAIDAAGDLVALGFRAASSTTPPLRSSERSGVNVVHSDQRPVSREIPQSTTEH